LKLFIPKFRFEILEESIKKELDRSIRSFCAQQKSEIIDYLIKIQDYKNLIKTYPGGLRGIIEILTKSKNVIKKRALNPMDKAIQQCFPFGGNSGYFPILLFLRAERSIRLFVT